MKNFAAVFIMFISNSLFAQDLKMAPDANMKVGGFKFLKIEHGGIWEKLGLKEGDIVKKVNGTPVKDEEAVKFLYSELKKDSQIEITIERKNKEQVIRYKIK